MMEITARRATAADAPTLAALCWQWRGGGRDEGRAAFLDSFSAWVVEHLATHVPFLVEVDGQPAGAAWLHLTSRIPTPELPDRPTGDVQSVYVVPELRNTGVGTALITAVVTDARKRGLQVVSVHANERAVSFYLRAGFQDGHHWLQWTSDT